MSATQYGIKASLRFDLTRDLRRAQRSLALALALDGPNAADLALEVVDIEEQIARVSGKHHRDNSRQ